MDKELFGLSIDIHFILSPFKLTQFNQIVNSLHIRIWKKFCMFTDKADFHFSIRSQQVFSKA